MEALKYLQQYFRDYPTGGAILAGAIACFAAVIVIASFGVDIRGSIPNVIYVSAIGVVFYLITQFLSEPAARRAAGFFVIFLIVAWIGAFIGSKVYPENLSLRCTVNFLESCSLTADEIAAKDGNKPKLKDIPKDSDISQDIKSKYQVFMQFAGYDRNTIITLANALANQGWNVIGRNRGGERIGSATGLAEVRYSNSSAKPAAEALAVALNASNISNKTINAVQVDIIRPNVLEVWIGQ
ncbi:hypothetical protein [Beijerinckia mobilis]|uniref:hypothetical protein n=1 Tax=Beijerinckia mobilis TaxID=231434 RepID=UPI000555022A|nr:hypothetical protein [Beijerinckia mobilis]